MLDPDGREARSCRGSDPGQAGLLKLPHGQCHQLIICLCCLDGEICVDDPNKGPSMSDKDHLVE